MVTLSAGVKFDVQEASDSTGDSACNGVSGECKHNTNFCDGSYLTGFCGGGASRQCCQPPSEPPTDPPATTANPGDAACLALSGTCNDFRFLTCTAGYTTGNCAGDSNRQCCMPCDATCEATEATDSAGDSACDGVFGICKHNSNFCPGSYLTGFCGGGAARQCCQP